jgi:hypothetical protein
MLGDAGFFRVLKPFLINQTFERKHLQICYLGISGFVPEFSGKR